MDHRDKLIQLVKMRGPLLPSQINKDIGTNTLFASAMLSELVDKKIIKLSNVKVGGSPVYYAPGQESKLQMYYDRLKDPEKKAFDRLKLQKVLRDIDQEPVIRVALRQIKDFAVPLDVNLNGGVDLFWRWYLITDNESGAMIKEQLGINEEKKEELLTELPTEPVDETGSLQVKETANQAMHKLGQQINSQAQRQTQQQTQQPTQQQTQQPTQQKTQQQSQLQSKPILQPQHPQTNQQVVQQPQISQPPILTSDVAAELKAELREQLKKEIQSEIKSEMQSELKQHLKATEQKVKKQNLQSQIENQQELNKKPESKTAYEKEKPLKKAQKKKEGIVKEPVVKTSFKIKEEPVKKVEEKKEPEGDDFYDEVKYFFKRNHVDIVDFTVIRKNSDSEFIVEVPSNVGSLRYFCKAKSKSKINDADLAAIYVQGQMKKLPVLLLTPGELTKKAKQMLDSEFKSITVKKIS